MSIHTRPIWGCSARLASVVALVSGVTVILLIAEARAPAACYILEQTNCCAVAVGYPPQSADACGEENCPQGGQVENGDVSKAKAAPQGQAGKRSFTSAAGASCKFRRYFCNPTHCEAEIWTYNCQTDTLTGDDCTGPPPV